MGTFREIAPQELKDNVFQAVGTDWMLVGSAKDGQANAMTASWGGMGILWRKPVAFVFIRPQRYTRELIDASETLSLTFYDEAYRQQLNLCGSKSGRDTDKIAACGFDVLWEGEAPYFAQSRLAVICKKLYRQPLSADCLLPAGAGIDGDCYPNKDYHILYVCEITKVLVKE